MRASQAVYNQHIREHTKMEFFNRGVIYSEHDIMKMRAEFHAEASPCPRCHMMVHPENIERHNQKHHPVEIAKVILPTAPIITDSTAFHIGQRVRISGTSHTLEVAEVKVMSKTWYRFEHGAGDVNHMWIEEGRLTSIETNLPVPMKRFTEEIKYPLAFPVSTAIVLYGAFQAA